MKKFLACAFVLILINTSCNNCPEDVPPYLDINSMWVSESNSFMKPEFANDSILFTYFRIMVEFGGEYYSANSNPGFSFISSAYASQPDDCLFRGYLGSQEKIEQLNVIALSNYNNQYRAGDTLNAITVINNDSLSTFITGANQQGIPAPLFYVSLSQKPDSKIKQAFRIDLKLQNGEAFTTTTPAIKIY